MPLLTKLDLGIRARLQSFAVSLMRNERDKPKALYLCFVLAMAVAGQAAAKDQGSTADQLFVAGIIAKIPGYSSMTPMDRVRAIRVFVFQNTPLAAEKRFYSKVNAETDPLSDVFQSFKVDRGGFWCGETAILLSRFYEAAGFSSLLYDFGREGILTHITTLVLVDGQYYLEDAYLDFDQLDKKGRAVPFLEGLRETRQLHPPAASARTLQKTGFFPDENTASLWFGQSSNTAPCSKIADGVKCTGPITLISFLDIFFLMPQTYKFLESERWPSKIAYLFLYPQRVFALQASGASDAQNMFHAISALSGRGPLKPTPQQPWIWAAVLAAFCAVAAAFFLRRLRFRLDILPELRND